MSQPTLWVYPFVNNEGEIVEYYPGIPENFHFHKELYESVKMEILENPDKIEQLDEKSYCWKIVKIYYDIITNTLKEKFSQDYYKNFFIDEDGEIYSVKSSKIQKKYFKNEIIFEFVNSNYGEMITNLNQFSKRKNNKYFDYFQLIFSKRYRYMFRNFAFENDFEVIFLETFNLLEDLENLTGGEINYLQKQWVPCIIAKYYYFYEGCIDNPEIITRVFRSNDFEAKRALFKKIKGLFLDKECKRNHHAIRGPVNEMFFNNLLENNNEAYEFFNIADKVYYEYKYKIKNCKYFNYKYNSYIEEKKDLITFVNNVFKIYTRVFFVGKNVEDIANFFIRFGELKVLSVFFVKKERYIFNRGLFDLVPYGITSKEVLKKISSILEIDVFDDILFSVKREEKRKDYYFLRLFSQKVTEIINSKGMKKFGDDYDTYQQIIGNHDEDMSFERQKEIKTYVKKQQRKMMLKYFPK